MVGSAGAGDRSKEAIGMMALHEALRSVCLNSDWTYSVLWTIRPRPRVRGGNGCKVGDENGSLLMGKVASDKCHKWVFKEPSDCEPNIPNCWQSSFDALPPEWTNQFESGIQTIAVIHAGHGLLQLGSCKIIPEDLHFVLRMRHTFESLGYQSGFYLSQLFSSYQNASSSTSICTKRPTPPVSPPPLSNSVQRPLTSPTSILASPNFQRPLGFRHGKDETHLFFMPQLAETRMEEMMGEHEADLKWPNGLSFFNALAGRADDTRLLFNPESLENKPEQDNHLQAPSLHTAVGAIPNELLSLDNHPDGMKKDK